MSFFGIIHDGLITGAAMFVLVLVLLAVLKFLDYLSGKYWDMTHK